MIVSNIALSSRTSSRGERPGTETMFGIDGLERDGAKAAGNGRVEVGPDALLMLEVNRLNIVGSNGHGLGIGVVHGGRVKSGRGRMVFWRVWFSGRLSQSSSRATR